MCSTSIWSFLVLGEARSLDFRDLIKNPIFDQKWSKLVVFWPGLDFLQRKQVQEVFNEILFH